jgi:hypothetical protein
VAVEPAVWNRPDIDWGGYDAVVIRSTWDYHHHREEFLEWLAHVASMTRLYNDLGTVRWNVHKQYLVELAEAGHSVVPTAIVRRSNPTALAELLQEKAWDQAVVKPAISASSEGLFRVAAPGGPEQERQFRTLLESSDALVQPFLSEAPAKGERSLVFFGGRFSHSAEYPYLLSAGSGNERQVQRRSPDPEEVRKCENILSEVGQVPLYARLDFLPIDARSWALGELELIEPELLFRADPSGGERFAEALLERWRAGR